MTTKRRDRVLILRGCRVDDRGQLYSSGGNEPFSWPRSGYVEAPDWDPSPVCGGGLHGFLWGEGDAKLWRGEIGVVVAASAADVVDLGGKVKFRCGYVVFSGSYRDAASYVKLRRPEAAVMYCIASAGNGGIASAGDHGIATAGDWGTASAGYRGTASAGDYGTASAGKEGTASAGYRGTASAGAGGCICIRGRDGIRCAAVDGVEIRAGVAYRLDDAGQFVEVER